MIGDEHKTTGIEVCNGKDNCNGINDDNASDARFGMLTPMQYVATRSGGLSLSVPSGYVADGADCNDRDNTIHPTAPGSVIRSMTIAISRSTMVYKLLWYLDADSDGLVM